MIDFKLVEFGKIPSHWKVSTIQEETEYVTDYVANGSFESLSKNVEYKREPDYAILIRLTDYNNNFKGPFVYVDKHAYDFLKKSKLQGGEIIISNVGAYTGTVFRAPRLNIPTTLGPNSVMLSFISGNTFYEYWLKSESGQYMLSGIISGSAQPKFNKTSFRKISIPVPPIEEQHTIADILSSLDDKIDLLNRQNETLEAMAQTLFRQWFIEEADDSWEETNIYHYLQVIYGFPFKSKMFNDSLGNPVIRIRNLKSGYSETLTQEVCDSKYQVVTGDVLAGMDGEFNLSFWKGSFALLNQRVCKFQGIEGIGNLFIKNLLKPHLDFYEQTNVGTTVIHLSKKDLDSIKIKKYPAQLMNQYVQVTNPFFEKLLVNYRSLISLNALRNTILPKLMSGDVRVKLD